MSFNQSHAFLSLPSTNKELLTMSIFPSDQSTKVQNFSLSEKAPIGDLTFLESIPAKQVPKQEFMNNAGPLMLSHSFTQEFGNSPNKKILAIFVHPNGYETFGYPKEEGWKHYLFS